MNSKDLFNKLREQPVEELDLFVRKTHNEVFAKTDCLACGNCCKSAPPIVTQKDIKRIAKFLGTTPKQVLRNHVIHDFNGEMSFDSVPCGFLGEDNKCSIYEARPFACRDYPHTNSGGFMKRKRLHLENVEICPAVEEIFEIISKKIEEDQS